MTPLAVQAPDAQLANTAPPFAPSAPVLIAIDLDDAARRPPQQNLLTLIDFQSGLPVFSIPGSERPIILHAAPVILTALLVGRSAQARADRFLAWLEQVGASRPPVIAWQRGTEVAASQQITRELARRVSASTQAQRRVAAEVVRLRGINAEMHHRFMVAESALLRSGAMPLELSFTNEPMTEPVQPVLLAETGAGIAQVLPVGSSGICAIGIHLAPLAEAPAGVLVAQLASLEDGKLLERWSVAAADLQPGWNVLALSRAVSGQSRTLELRLARQGAEDRLPAISLGSGQPILQFQVREQATGQSLLRNSLAMQVWRGLPGAALPAWLKAHRPARPARPTAGFAEIPLSPADLMQVELANPEDVAFDFPAVVGPPGERVILCHAPVTGLTLARLPGAAPHDTVRFSASAFIDNQQSRDVDFALIIAPDTQTARAIACGDAVPKPQEAFSGWCQVNNRQLRRLSALREVHGSDMAMFVATRMTVPGDNSFARARFKDLSVMVQA